MKTGKEIFSCEFFKVEELSSGVYAAYATEKGGALSNSGIVDLGDKTVVFDAFMSVDAAGELKRFAEKATGRKVSYVVNSHSHFDHIMGNCAFDSDTEIISSHGTYKELKAHEGEICGMKTDAPQIISSLKEKLEEEKDEPTRTAIMKDVNLFQMVAKDSFYLRLPSITFEGSMELTGASRKAILLGNMKGHTESDTILYLPEEKIAFMGDLLFTGTHPWLGSGNPETWLSTINVFSGYDTEMLVPGHGQAGAMYELSLIEGYIKEMAILAAAINEGSIKQGDLSPGMLPEPYCSWKGNKLLPNLKFYCEYLEKSVAPAGQK